MKQDLEKLARESGKTWHPSEVLIAVYEEVEGLSFAEGGGPSSEQPFP